MPRLPDDLFPDEPERPRLVGVDPGDYWWAVRLAEALPSPETFAVARAWALGEVRRADAELDEVAPGWREWES